MAQELMSVQAWPQAAKAVHLGLVAFADNPRLPQFMTKLQTLAKQGDQPALATTLKGLGYGGE
ncbi:MAG: hypothetical protein R3E96_03590 [Planctomycetota bacterium]